LKERLKQKIVAIYLIAVPINRQNNKLFYIIKFYNTIGVIVRKLEPIIEYEGARPYWLCPRYGQPMYEENIPEDRKCPNIQQRFPKGYGGHACSEGCYYNPAMEPLNREMERKKKTTKSKSKRKVCRCKK
jgi:hypothetical protein